MHWIKADASDFGGILPIPRSGHSAVIVGKSKVVVFGGFADKRFLDDVSVCDIENGLWFSPECTGSGSDEQIGPPPRAFHVAVAIDCHMFIFGGRSGSRRLGDFWMLDTDIWQWSELTSFGDLPSPREFSAASPIGNRKIVMYGGWDGKKWLSDVYILDTISLEWMELSVSGSGPPPRCGHTATMVEKRLLVYGGRGGGGPIMGDLWALKGLIEEGNLGYQENETAGWTQLKLPGQPPSPRCGHTMTSGGHYLLLFGGHGTGGWLSRYDIYHNDSIVLDRVSVQWKRLLTNNEPPPARAYHSMTCIGSRYLLFGGFDGKTTFGDLWWLVPEDDPIAKRLPSATNTVPDNRTMMAPSYSSQSLHKNLSWKNLMPSTRNLQENQMGDSPIGALQRRLGISASSASPLINFVDEVDDKELIELSSRFVGQGLPVRDQVAAIESLRHHWRSTLASSIQLRELGPLLRDYQRLIVHHYQRHFASDSESIIFPPFGQGVHRFLHLRSASQLRMGDVPMLLSEYKQLVAS